MVLGRGYSSAKKTTYLVDTNVPILNPNFFEEFPDAKFIICRTVLDELDGIKSNRSGKEARNARFFMKLLEKEVMGGAKTWEIFDNEVVFEKGDDNILNALKQMNSVVLLSHDRNLRLRAHCAGYKVQDYCFDEPDVFSCGITKTFINKEALAEFRETLTLRCEAFPWQSFEVLCSDVPSFSFVGVYNPNTKQLVHIGDKTKSMMGLSPKNIEQSVALWYLTNPEIKLVTIAGKAGSGKTILSLAAALGQIIQGKEYAKMLITRPVVALGEQDIGFIPGSLDDKMAVWMQPVYDNMEQLISSDDSSKRGSKGGSKPLSTEYLAEAGIVEVAALAYIRGRSIRDQFVIIDEAQNLSKEELKTILTRCGENTKIVLTGDMDQTDIPRDKSGLRQVINAFKNSLLAAHVTLQVSERSDLAEEAATLL